MASVSDLQSARAARTSKSASKRAPAKKAAKAAKQPAKRASAAKKAAAAPPPEPVGKFERVQVFGYALVLKGVGDGLSKAVEADPTSGEIRHHDRVRVLVDAHVSSINFPDLKGTSGVQRVAVLTTDTAIIVPQSFGETELAKAREQMREAEDKRLGREPLFKGDGPYQPRLDDE